MPDDGVLQLSERERLAVVETLLRTVISDVERLIVKVDQLFGQVSQQGGQDKVTSRLDSAVIAGGAALFASLVTLLLTFLLHH